MNLLINFFTSKEEHRNKEYIFCLSENINNSHIKRIFLFVEKEEDIPKIVSEKIEIVEIENRPVFQDLIRYANEKLAGERCIISNSDIIFDGTLRHLDELELSDYMIALTRWDINKEHTIEYYDKDNKGWTQDAWVFEPPIKIEEADFFIGVPGQENRIAYLAHEAGLHVINPAFLIIIKHLHITDYTRDSDSRAEKNRTTGKYLYVKGSGDFTIPDIYEGAYCSEQPDGQLQWTREVFKSKKNIGFFVESKDDRLNVLVTGGNGMVGTALKKYLSTKKNENPFYIPDIKFLSSEECDLRHIEKTDKLFQENKPRVVLHLAGRVGGVKANTSYVADFYFENMLINMNVLHSAYKHEVDKLVCMLSTCIYPDRVEYPIKESSLHAGPPHDSNFGYAYAKRMMEVQCRAYRQQYGTNFINVVPNNIFGENDNFDLDDGHVIPSIIRKIYEAKKNNETAYLWGDGSALRQFTYSYDIAKMLFFLTKNYNEVEPINIGCGKEYSIKQTAEAIAEILGYDKEIGWQLDMPSGQPRKPSDLTKLEEMGWSEYTDFRKALENTCKWFVKNYPKIRGVESGKD